MQTMSTKQDRPVLYVGGVLPCLNCGEMIDFAKGDVHLCRAERGAWLKRQKEAIVMLSDGAKFDLKSKKVIK
jgi:hypothetical protein